MGEIKAFPKKKKQKIANNWLIFTVVILSILLIISLSIMFSEIYKQRSLIPGNIPLGTDTIISVNSQGAFATTITYDGSNIPGAEVMQNVKIKIPNQQKKAVVRAKIYTCDEGGNFTEILAQTTEDWIKKDGFYYYNDVLDAGTTLTLFKKITLPTEEDFFNVDKYYEIIVLVETLEFNSSNYNYMNIWQNAPDNWLDI